MGATVLAGCETPLVLEFAEHVLDLVAMLVENSVIVDFVSARIDLLSAGLSATDKVQIN